MPSPPARCGWYTPGRRGRRPVVQGGIARFGDYVYGVDVKGLEAVVLSRRRSELTPSTSCTGCSRVASGSLHARRPCVPGRRGQLLDPCQRRRCWACPRKRWTSTAPWRRDGPGHGGGASLGQIGLCPCPVTGVAGPDRDERTTRWGWCTLGPGPAVEGRHPAAGRTPAAAGGPHPGADGRQPRPGRGPAVPPACPSGCCRAPRGLWGIYWPSPSERRLLVWRTYSVTSVSPCCMASFPLPVGSTVTTPPVPGPG